MRKIYLGLFLFMNFCFYAQKISGVIIDAETNIPIENATVFVENSSVNTYSKKDGSFELDLKELKNTIIVDYLGYFPYIISADEINQNKILIKLRTNNEVLDELVIHKSPFTRKQMMQAFKRYFLGNTSNGKSCKIHNEKDILLYFDLKTNTLVAESLQPIIIENHNLDYLIKFYLEEFRVVFNARSLDFFNYKGSVFYGYTFFTDKSKNIKKSNIKRNRVYEAGFASFFKALADGKLQEKRLGLYVDKFPVDEKDYFISEANEDGFVITNIKKPTKKVPAISEKENKFIIIAGDDQEKMDILTHFVVYNSKTKDQSIMEINGDKIQIDKQGNLLFPGQVFFGGYFGNLKLGDMLPIDYKKQ